MKKLFLIPALALALASCSNEENIVELPDSGTVPGNGFLTLAIAQSPVMPGSRAGDPLADTGGIYENGTDDENEVTRIRFYFFDDEGGAFAVKKNSASGNYNNYIDWYPTTGDSDGPIPNETVEKVYNATLSLNLENPDSYPAQVVAILNPTLGILNLADGTDNADNLQGPSLSDLKGVVADFQTNLTSAGKFVMSNSVYVKGEGDQAEVMYATPISDDNIYSTEEDSEHDPVTIYVERVVARVDFTVSEEMEETKPGSGIYKAIDLNVLNTEYDEDGNPQKTTNTSTPIYVKFLGWNTTATTNNSRLLKDVSPTWGKYAILGNGMIWNTSDYFRSFWAINPNPEAYPGFGYNYGNLLSDSDYVGSEGTTNVNPANGQPMPAAGEYGKIYIQENAAPYTPNTGSPANPTKLIIAAQLCDVDGNALTLAQWGGKTYTMDGLKAQLCILLSNMCYQVPGATDGTTNYKHIAPEDLAFSYSYPIEGTENNDKNYVVYVTLSETGLGRGDWYLQNGTTYTKFDNANAIETYILDNTNSVMLYQTGYTYYFFNIRHLGKDKTDPGYDGIVRNHIYRIDVTGVNGLGVPVYDPRQEIIPEEKAPETAVLDAEIKILQWRVVSQDFELSWGN